MLNKTNSVLVFLAQFSILFVYFANCASTKKVTETNFQDQIEKTSFFQKIKVNPNQDYVFDRGSNRSKYLIIRKQGDSHIAKEIEIGLYSYSASFLDKVKDKFPQSNTDRYSINESVKTGQADIDPVNKTITIQFEDFYFRKANDMNLLEAIDRLLSLPYQTIKSNREKVILSVQDDGGLWKQEEQLFLEKNKPLIWKHNEGGGLIKKFAFTELVQNGKETEVHRIWDTGDLVYQRTVPEESQKPNKLFQNRDFVIYYFPDEKYHVDNTNLVTLQNAKRQLTLYKNQPPIFVYKKNPNQEEPRN